MVRLNRKSVAFLFLALGQLGASGSLGQQVKLVERARIRTAVHGLLAMRGTCRCERVSDFELGASAEANKVQDVNPDSVAVRIEAKGGRCRRVAPPRPALRRGGLGMAEDQD